MMTNLDMINHAKENFENLQKNQVEVIAENNCFTPFPPLALRYYYLDEKEALKFLCNATFDEKTNEMFSNDELPGAKAEINNLYNQMLDLKHDNEQPKVNRETWTALENDMHAHREFLGFCEKLATLIYSYKYKMPFNRGIDATSKFTLAGLISGLSELVDQTNEFVINANPVVMATAYNYLGICHIEAKNYDEANKKFRLADIYSYKATDEESAPSCVVKSSWAQVPSSEIAVTIKAHQEALDMKSFSALPQEFQGAICASAAIAFWKAGQWNRALELHKEAFEKWPKHFVIANNYAIAMAKSENQADVLEAIQIFQAKVEANPKGFVSIYYCALGYYNAFGKKHHVKIGCKRAMEYLAKAEEALKDPRYEDAYRLKSKVKITLLCYEYALAVLESKVNLYGRVVADVYGSKALPHLEKISAWHKTVSEALDLLSQKPHLSDKHAFYSKRYERANARKEILQERFAQKDVAVGEKSDLESSKLSMSGNV